MWLECQVIVVIPAHNEARHIQGVLLGIPAWVDHVLVVDDGSVDATAELARSVQDPRVTVLQQENQGVGAALVTGYRQALRLAHSAQAGFVVMAGDGQMDPEDLPKLVDPIARGEADYVKGERFTSVELRRTMPWGRRLGGAVFSRLTTWALGIPVTDSQCGYTALSRTACLQLNLGDLWTGYGYPNDLLGQLVVQRCRIAQAPVRPIYRDETSGLKLRHLPRIGWLIARACWRVRRAPH